MISSSAGPSSSPISINVYFPVLGTKFSRSSHLFLVLSENFFLNSLMATSSVVWGPLRLLWPLSPWNTMDHDYNKHHRCKILFKHHDVGARFEQICTKGMHMLEWYGIVIGWISVYGLKSFMSISWLHLCSYCPLTIKLTTLPHLVQQ